MAFEKASLFREGTVVQSVLCATEKETFIELKRVLKLDAEEFQGSEKSQTQIRPKERNAVKFQEIISD